MGSNWSGFAPVQPSTFTIRQWADDRSGSWTNEDGSEVRWWEGDPQPGVRFRPTNCDGAFTCPMLTCADCDCNPDPAAEAPAEPCVSPLPDVVEFHPFWVYKKHECDPVSQDPNEMYRRLRDQLDVQGWVQVARRFHLELQARTTDVSDGVATPTQGLATLLRNRGVLGLGGGAFVAPAYALPALMERNLVATGPNGRLTGPAGIPMIVDPGFPVTGPGQAAPEPGAAYIYLIDSPPVVAFRDEADPGGTEWDWNNPFDRRLFWNDSDPSCENCFTPIVRRRGIAVHNPCSSFAIQIGTS